MYQEALSLLLLTYFVAVVNCQSECDRAEDAVINNEPCFNAFLGISAAFDDNTTIDSIYSVPGIVYRAY